MELSQLYALGKSLRTGSGFDGEIVGVEWTKSHRNNPFDQVIVTTTTEVSVFNVADQKCIRSWAFRAAAGTSLCVPAIQHPLTRRLYSVQRENVVVSWGEKDTDIKNATSFKVEGTSKVTSIKTSVAFPYAIVATTAEGGVRAIHADLQRELGCFGPKVGDAEQQSTPGEKQGVRESSRLQTPKKGSKTENKRESPKAVTQRETETKTEHESDASLWALFGGLVPCDSVSNALLGKSLAPVVLLSLLKQEQKKDSHEEENINGKQSQTSSALKLRIYGFVHGESETKGGTPDAKAKKTRGSTKQGGAIQIQVIAEHTILEGEDAEVASWCFLPSRQSISIVLQDGSWLQYRLPSSLSSWVSSAPALVFRKKIDSSIVPPLAADGSSLKFSSRPQRKTRTSSSSGSSSDTYTKTVCSAARRRFPFLSSTHSDYVLLLTHGEPSSAEARVPDSRRIHKPSGLAQVRLSAWDSQFGAAIATLDIHKDKHTNAAAKSIVGLVPEPFPSAGQGGPGERTTLLDRGQYVLLVGATQILVCSFHYEGESSLAAVLGRGKLSSELLFSGSGKEMNVSPALRSTPSLTSTISKMEQQGSLDAESWGKSIEKEEKTESEAIQALSDESVTPTKEKFEKVFYKYMENMKELRRERSASVDGAAARKRKRQEGGDAQGNVYISSWFATEHSSVSLRRCPELLDTILRAKYLKGVEEILCHVADLPEKYLIRILRFILQTCDDDLLVSYIQSLRKETAEETLKLENGKKESKKIDTADKMQLEGLHHESQSERLTNRQEALERFLGLIVSAKRSDVILIKELQDLSLAEVELLLSYLRRTVKKLRRGAKGSVNGVPPVRQPSMSQAIDWIGLSIEAHFARIVTRTDVQSRIFDLFQELSAICEDEISICESMEGLRGHVSHLMKKKKLPVKPLPDYSTENIQL